MRVNEAIQRMRLLRQAGQDFGLVFVTSTPPYELRKYERCTLRSRPIDADGDKAAGTGRAKFTMTDRFLYFDDLESGEPKQCRKRLIRKVRIGTAWHDVTLE